MLKTFFIKSDKKLNNNVVFFHLIPELCKKSLHRTYHCNTPFITAASVFT